MTVEPLQPVEDTSIENADIPVNQVIPSAPTDFSKVVDDIDAMDMNNKDIMGDVYEYLLGKIAGHGLDKEIICQKCANTASTLTNAMVDVEKLLMYSLATVQHQTPF